MTRSRGARTAVAAVAVLVLVLVAVLVGLVRSGGSEVDPAASSAPARTATATATGSVPVPVGSEGRPSPRVPAPSTRDPESGLLLVALRDLPRQAQETVALIDAGGPFPYSQDGVTFGNNERLLPAHPRGWYREYTVRTPSESDRGPRRIVTGDDDRQIFYTADHYASFVRVTR